MPRHQWSMHPLGNAITPAYVEAACEILHDAYDHGAARQPWPAVPEQQKAALRTAVTALLIWQEGRTITDTELVSAVRERGYRVLGR